MSQYFEAINYHNDDAEEGYNYLNSIQGHYGDYTRFTIGVNNNGVYCFRVASTDDWNALGGSGTVPQYAYAWVSTNPFTAQTFGYYDGSYSVSVHVALYTAVYQYMCYHQIGAGGSPTGYYADLIPTDFRTVASEIGLASSYPISYQLANCTAPNAPTEALVGDNVTVSFTFPEGYGIVNNANVYVTNNRVLIPSTYTNGQLTFTMPNPAQ